jgi:hypothetical protein
MKRVVSDIVNAVCKPRDITDDERTVFSQYTHLQRYHPGLDKFPSKRSDESHDRDDAFPLRYSLTRWNRQPGNESPNHYQCERSDILHKDASGEQVNVFVKIIHLLDPISMLREEYMTPAHPLLPQGERAWRTTLQKLHSPNNQAYVDTIANHILSRFRELDMTPHCTLSYGSLTGIAEMYKFRISDDFSSYRQCRWFWRGMKRHGAKLNVLKDNENITDSEEYAQYFTSPFPVDDGSSVTELSSEELQNMNDIEDGAQSIHSFTFDEDAMPTLLSSESNPSMFNGSNSDTAPGSDSDMPPPSIGRPLESSEEEDSDNSGDSDSNSDSDSDSDSEESEESFTVNLEIPNMPVILVYQECHEGTMDMLLEMDEISGFKRGSKIWEKVWLAWSWQVVAVLGFLQKSICFTHNDLHTNNVLWRTTTEEFLYYRARDGTTWRIPTYGKIFSLIDFGRAIFRIGKQLWISDDHWPDNDAGGQYNFGPIRNIYQAKVTPNPSFDLCRLAVSMLDGLFEDIPDKRKGKIVPALSRDGSWVVHETKSDLFNLLYSWTIDDSGKTIYETRHGEERYPGFELYIRIARDIHKAIPREQFTRPPFDIFRFNGKVPAKKTVYSIGC